MENYTEESEFLFNVTSTQTGLVQTLLEQGFRASDIGKIDGSGFIIDLDADGTADIVRMLLVDQGWFDTRPDIVGLIGDPLLPLIISESNISESNISESNLATLNNDFDLPVISGQNKRFPSNQLLEIPNQYRKIETSKDQAGIFAGSYSSSNNQNDFSQEDAPNYNYNKNSDFFSRPKNYLPIKSNNISKRIDNNPIGNFVSDLLDNPSRFSIPSMLGVLMSTLTGELVASNTAKKFNPAEISSNVVQTNSEASG